MSQLDDTIATAMSDEVPVDFSGAKDNNFEPLPDGDYTAKVTEAKVGVAKSGNPKVQFTFEVTDGPHAGRMLFRHCPTSGAGSGILRDALVALGFNVDEMKAFSPKTAIGRTAVLTVARQANNPAFNEVKRMKAAPTRQAL